MHAGCLNPKPCKKRTLKCALACGVVMPVSSRMPTISEDPPLIAAPSSSAPEAEVARVGALQQQARGGGRGDQLLCFGRRGTQAQT